MLGVVGQQCCIRLHTALGSYKEYCYISLSFANYWYLLNYEN